MNLVFFLAPKGPAASFAHIEPIRAELFSIERLEQHGETLAVAQRVPADPGRGRAMEPAEITSRGEVYSCTVNYQRWLPDLEVPYAVVLVEFADHPGVRVAGRLRGCPPQEAAIGMTVDVGFEPGPGGFAIPSFVAARATACPDAEQA